MNVKARVFVHNIALHVALRIYQIIYQDLSLIERLRIRNKWKLA